MARKILIVDDEPDIVEILQKKLLMEGYEVVTAFDGQEALVSVEENDPFDPERPKGVEGSNGSYSPLLAAGLFIGGR